MKSYFIKNKKGEYLYQTGKKLEFKEGIMLALEFKSKDDVIHYCLNKNSKVLKDVELEIECIEFDD